jgi:Na+/H+-dicarboxylate symporter
MSGQKHAFHRTLYFRVICGIVIGVAVGFLFPETAQVWLKS